MWIKCCQKQEEQQSTSLNNNVENKWRQLGANPHCAHYHGTITTAYLYRKQLNGTLRFFSEFPTFNTTYQVVVVIHIVLGERLKVSERKQGCESVFRQIKVLITVTMQRLHQAQQSSTTAHTKRYVVTTFIYIRNGHARKQYKDTTCTYFKGHKKSNIKSYY